MNQNRGMLDKFKHKLGVGRNDFLCTVIFILLSIGLKILNLNVKIFQKLLF